MTDTVAGGIKDGAPNSDNHSPDRPGLLLDGLRVALADACDEQWRVYQARTLRAALRHAPLTSAFALLVSLTLFLAFRSALEPVPLAIGAGLPALFATLNLIIAWRQRAQAADAPVSRTLKFSVTAIAALNALFFALLGSALYAAADGTERALLISLIVMLMGVGAWSTACYPLIALAWALPLGLGFPLGLVLVAGWNGLALAGIIGLYAAALVAMVLLSSSRYLRGLRAEQEHAGQKQIARLLLNEFDSVNGDWLWESDANGRLSAVSERMAAVIGRPAGALQGQFIIDVIEPLSVPCETLDEVPIEALNERLIAGEPFNGLIVAVRLAGQPRWWSIAAAPMRDQAGKVVGWKGVGSDVSSAQQRIEQLSAALNRDALTGLPSAHAFMAGLAEAFTTLKSDSRRALLLVELDTFKQIDQALAGLGAQSLLIEATARLKQTLPSGDTLGRLEGAQFLVMPTAELGRTALLDYAAHLQLALSAPWDVDGHHLTIASNVGIARAPEHANSPMALLDACRMALAEARRCGPGQSVLFDERIKARAKAESALLDDLLGAIERDEFVVHYQPQVQLESGQLAGFEALVRWNHPQRGIIEPDDFIPLAERSGLMIPLGELVMFKACKDAARWPRRLRLAVNLSRRQLLDVDLRDLIDSALEASEGMTHNRLELEINETDALELPGARRKALGWLRDSGVRIVLDDFGVSYTSLSSLRDLPLDKLKIDRSYVHSIRNAIPTDHSIAVMRAVVSLANTFGLETSAVGIEVDIQHRMLKHMGCTYGQGYHYAKPLNRSQTTLRIAGSGEVGAETGG